MSGLRDPYPITLAAVKSGVLVSLIEKYMQLNPDFIQSLPKGRYGINLKAPGISQKISLNRGDRGVILRFPRHSDMIAILSGEKGLVIPLPNGPSYLSALKAFKLCAGAVAQSMAFVPVADDKEGVERKSPLLLTATLKGVCEVYNYDHWLKLKSSSLPAGNIGITVADNPESGGIITIEGGHMSLDPKGDKKKVNANLEFKTTDVCYRVLTGSLPAMGAVGDKRIMLSGRLPLIQGLFPLLDRFGEIMS